MLRTMAWTQSELDALKTQYALGVLSVTHNGRTTTFPSARDMLSRIKMMESEINAASTTRMKPRYQQARFDD